MAIVRDDEDRRCFVRVFGECVAAHALVCHGYCLMDTHYHAVVTTTHPNLSRAMHDLNTSYATWWNRRHKTTGHLFQGRFTAKIVQEDGYLITVCRYVALNPVKARLVMKPEDWPWSSYRATAGLEDPPAFLWTDLLLGQFGALDGEAAQRYRRFVEEGLRDGAESATWRGPIIGDRAFVARFAGQLHRAPHDVVPLDRRAARPTLDDLFRGAIRRGDRDRQIGAAHREHQYSMTQIARFLDLHPSSVGKILARVRFRKTLEFGI